ncbi:hypothetical protein [Mycolicibacterium llatzerense]|uniref:hypothetical protein n=1 Tax=Mycolicibacterium llatzerense TaxID=280871 RepID=UPI0008DE8857|nr:hypothetical protein [Mycolicibacterium llatzerense]
MSRHITGRHRAAIATAIPAHHFINPAASSTPRPGRASAAAIAGRSYPTTALALTTATALAFAPLIATQHPAPALPAVSVPHVQLTALVDTAAVRAVIASANNELNSLDATVTAIVGVPGQTISGALATAATLNTHFWQGLTGAAQGNPLLLGTLKALQSTSSGALTQLASTVGDLNGDLTLTTDQLTTLLTSTLAGSATTAAVAAAAVVNDPLSLVNYLGLLTAPLNIAGEGIDAAIQAVADLTVNGLSAADTVIHGVTGEIGTVVDGVNSLLGGVKGAINNPTIDGLITAAQAVAIAPVTGLLAAVNGASSVITGALGEGITVVATEAQNVVSTWLGDATSPGAVAAAVKQIGSAPLSPAAYIAAVGDLGTAAVSTVMDVTSGLVSGLAPIPFRAAAKMVNAGASVLNAWNNGVAQLGAGLGEAVGLPPMVTNALYGVAAVANTAVNVTAAAISGALNAIAATISFGTKLTGLYSPASPAAAKATAATAAVAAATSKLKTTGAEAVGAVKSAVTPTTATPKPAKKTKPAKNSEPTAATKTPATQSDPASTPKTASQPSRTAHPGTAKHESGKADAAPVKAAATKAAPTKENKGGHHR